MLLAVAQEDNVDDIAGCMLFQYSGIDAQVLDSRMTDAYDDVSGDEARFLGGGARTYFADCYACTAVSEIGHQPGGNAPVTARCIGRRWRYELATLRTNAS